jgi:hypothetical protein
VDTGNVIILALAPLAMLAVASALGLTTGLGFLGDLLGTVFSPSDSDDGGSGGDGGSD